MAVEAGELDFKEIKQRIQGYIREGLKDERLKREIALGLLLVCLAIFLILRLFFSSYKIKMIERQKKLISDSVPVQYRNVNEAGLNKFKQGVASSRQRLLGLVALFDPLSAEYAEGYEGSLYFVEQLQKIEQSLKLKAENKGLKFTNLGFSQDLPSEKEAVFYLKQLDALNVLVDKGLDYGINFKSVSPQGVDQKDSDIDFLRLLLRLEFKVSPSDFVEYVSEIREIVPLIGISSLKAEKAEEQLEVAMLLEHLHCAGQWRSAKLEKPIPIDDVIGDSNAYLRILRGTNPFFPEKKGEAKETIIGELKKEPKKERFIFKGSAVFRGRSVAVIEDTLTKDTVFLAEGESIAGFQLQSLSKDNIVLLGPGDSAKEITIKRKY